MKGLTTRFEWIDPKEFDLFDLFERLCSRS